MAGDRRLPQCRWSNKPESYDKFRRKAKKRASFPPLPETDVVLTLLPYAPHCIITERENSGLKQNHMDFWQGPRGGTGLESWTPRFWDR